MWHVWWRGDMNTWFWWGNLREGDHLEDLDKFGGGALDWFRTEKNNWLL
jgi:hypothetical protein